MRGRLVIIALAALAVAIAFLASDEDDAGRKAEAPATGTRPTGGDGALHVSFVYSPEKEPLLAPLVKRFNAERRTSGGRPAVVDASVVASGEAETAIAAGEMRPVLWSPASSFWGRLLNYEADRPLVADDNPSIVRTPLVIAMWKELADAYGYPRRPLGFGDLADLATRGWAAAGRPQFGAFKYVHTNPDFSTSGMSAVAASYFAAVGKREGLTVADVERGRDEVRRLERSIVHYGDTTLFIAEEMRKRGLGYASAAAMEETTLIDFNRDAGDGERLVAVYPEEGTFFSDNPLITLGGDWVTAEQERAGKVFADFLAEAITPEVAGAEGFRPADPTASPAGLVSEANGVDPAQPARILQVPEARVLARIRSAWRADRKPANVMVVFDTSSSMGEESKIRHARDGLTAFFREAARQDRMGLTKFSSAITPLVPIAPLATNRRRLLEAVEGLRPEEDTSLREAALAGVRAVEQDLDPDAINAVVLLTDGHDTASSITPSQAVRELERQGRKESGQIRVFTIAYGRDPDQVTLKQFASATGGNSYEGGTSEIEAIYRKISSFF